MKLFKRIALTLLAFLLAGVFIALWKDYVAPNALSGALMAVIAWGIVYGAWKWSEKIK